MQQESVRLVSVRRSYLAFRTALLMGGALVAFAPAAIAQDAADDRVLVTGSRIARTGMTTPTPVTTVDATELQTIAPGNLIEVFDALPQFLGNSTPQTAGNFAGAVGASNLNMRGLDSKRSLVLLDGRRVVSSNRLGTVDISVFPEAVIQRVEVVTGGASAAYGTDAVAGVTNFILNTEFTGFRGHIQGGTSDRWDNKNVEASITAGADLTDRLHVMGSVEYYSEEEIHSYVGRDWYQGWGTVTNPAWQASPANARVGPQLLTAPNVVDTRAPTGGMIWNSQRFNAATNRWDTIPNASIYHLIFNSDGTPTPFIYSDLSAPTYGTFSQSVADQFGGGSGTNPRADPNRTTAGSLSPKAERASFFGYVDYDLTDNLNVFVQGLYGDTRVAQNGGTTVFESIWSGYIYSGNPYLPASVQAAMTAEGVERFNFQRTHSSADLAQGRLSQTNKTTSLTAGFSWEVPSSGLFADWTANGYYQYGRNKNHIQMHKFVRTERLIYALDAVRDPVSGATVCNITLQNPDFYCVPINLFGEGNASQEAIDYVLGDDRPNKDVFATVRQDFAELSASGPVWRGFGAGEVSLAVGASYREDSFEQDVGPDDLVAMRVPGDNPAAGIRGVPSGFFDRPLHQFSTAEDIAGSFTVKEVFAETAIPLIAQQPFAERLEANLAARWADYSGSGGIWAWKAGLDWQIYSDLRLRGTVSRDVRAGTLSERFDQQGQGATSNDPEFGNDSFAHSQIQGGNPNIDPEKADTVTIGAVYQPSYLPGFGISVDWYDIKLKGAIDLLGVQRIIDDCFAGAQDLCALIERNPDGTLKLVQNIYQNVDAMRVNGVDVEVSYRTDVDLLGGGAESLSARVLASFLTENSTTNIGADPVDSAGQPPFFEEKVTASLTYNNGPLRMNIQGRYLGEAVRNATWEEGVDIDWNTIDSRFYTDAGVSYTIERNDGSSIELFGNVQNLFDVDPPLAPTWFSGFGGAIQTQEDQYDVIGRRFTAGVRVAF